MSTPRSLPHLVWVNHYAVSPREGGGTRHFELARELGKLGWHVSIFASDFNLHARAYSRRRDRTDRRVITEELDGVRFLWVWASEYQTNDWRRLRNWVSFANGVRRLSTLDGPPPSVVIGSSPDLVAALGASAFARRARLPFVLEVRDLWPESMLAAGLRRGPLFHALSTAARHLYGRAKLIVVLTEGTRRHLVERGIRTPICHAPNGVDLGAFAGSGPQGNGAITFMYIGAHGPMNGLDVLLDAAGQLVDDRSIRIVLVGDGPEKRRLMSSAQAKGLSNVEFRSPIPKEQVPALLHEADAGLMILREAPLFAFGVSPNKLFDYLGASLPVVSNVPGELAQLVADANAGEVAAPGQANDLARAIRKVASYSPDERRHLGEAGRRWVAENHSREVVAAKLDVALRSLL